MEWKRYGMMLCDDCLHADICENTTQGNCDWYLSEIRWIDKLSVKSNGDIIDFEGRVVGHIDLNVMRSGTDNEKNDK